MILGLGPQLAPLPPQFAYPMIIPLYAFGFWLGWARFRVSGPVDDTAQGKRLTVWTGLGFGLILPLVMVMLVILRPSGPLFGVLVTGMDWVVMFIFGALLSSGPDLKTRIDAGPDRRSGGLDDTLT